MSTKCFSHCASFKWSTFFLLRVLKSGLFAFFYSLLSLLWEKCLIPSHVLFSNGLTRSKCYGCYSSVGGFDAIDVGRLAGQFSSRWYELSRRGRWESWSKWEGAAHPWWRCGRLQWLQKSLPLGAQGDVHAAGGQVSAGLDWWLHPPHVYLLLNHLVMRRVEYFIC